MADQNRPGIAWTLHVITSNDREIAWNGLEIAWNSLKLASKQPEIFSKQPPLAGKYPGNYLLKESVKNDSKIMALNLPNCLSYKVIFIKVMTSALAKSLLQGFPSASSAFTSSHKMGWRGRQTQLFLILEPFLRKACIFKIGPIFRYFQKITHPILKIQASLTAADWLSSQARHMFSSSYHYKLALLSMRVTSSSSPGPELTIFQVDKTKHSRNQLFFLVYPLNRDSSCLKYSC